MRFFSRKKKKTPLPECLINKVFKGSSFNNWFYLDSVEEAKSKGYPFSNAYFVLEENIMIAHGTKDNESPRDFIDNNCNCDFTIDESIQPMDFKGKLIYYAKRLNSKTNIITPNINLNFVFHSSDHLRYENRRHVAGPHTGGAPWAVKVEPNINGNEDYTITLFNTDNDTARVQMAPKQMKLQDINDSEIKLVGFGYDQMGSPFSDYGLTIYHEGAKIIKCKLHMFDRNVDIEYLK